MEGGSGIWRGWGPADEFMLNYPSAVAIDGAGNLWVLPRQGHAYAEQMKEAAAEMERLRQDLVGSPSSNGNGRADYGGHKN